MSVIARSVELGHLISHYLVLLKWGSPIQESRCLGSVGHSLILLKSGLPEECRWAAPSAEAALGFLLHPASQSQNARRVSLAQAGNSLSLYPEWRLWLAGRQAASLPFPAAMPNRKVTQITCKWMRYKQTQLVSMLDDSWEEKAPAPREQEVKLKQ
ncbi:hypothetical protein E2C01_034402 [Portunus trituberculatus]|uniref:Uncharacterized protein n=1 Tax=Portunus trituberculatus TaxID=210409 RepID=A0A5B7F6Y7_PORTR|nr:hypothetical protein [Portunus trituberculatus]